LLFAGGLPGWLAAARRAGLLATAVLCGVGAVSAQQRPLPDTYVGTTANMTPSGLPLKMDVTSWQDEGARGAVTAALEGEDASEALAELPTVGYLWVDGSPVGYSLKYAHRATTDAGQERVTVVTTPMLGTYGIDDWVPESADALEAREYSVVELRIGDGVGSGTASLAAQVDIDKEAQLVSLQWNGGAPLIADVARQSPPYWAEGG
jgi:hypothetical protein